MDTNGLITLASPYSKPYTPLAHLPPLTLLG